MALVMVKENELSATQTVAMQGGWLQRLNQWFGSRQQLRRQWDHKGLTSSGRRVPYRVWCRHGAYLDIQRQHRKH
jgi:hypothetical protein